MSQENDAIADNDESATTKTTAPKPEIDIDALLLEAGLDGVLAEVHVSLVDDEAKVAAINALQVEDRRLAAEIKGATARREAIKKVIKSFFKPGDEALIVVEKGRYDGSQPEGEELVEQHRVVAKMSYPEPTVTVNTAYVKEHYPYPEHREFYTVKESTPRLLVQDLPA